MDMCSCFFPTFYISQVIWSGRPDWLVLKRNMATIRTGPGQIGLAYRLEPFSLAVEGQVLFEL